MRGIPIGAPGIMQPEAEEQRLQAQLRVLHRQPRCIARATQVADRFVFDGRDVHCREVARAEQPRQRDRIPPVGLHRVAGFARDQRRRDHLTRDAFACEIAVQPVAARPGLIRDLQSGGFPLQAAQQLIDVGLTTADFSDEHRGRGITAGVSDRNRIVVDVQTDEQRSRLGHG